GLFLSALAPAAIGPATQTLATGSVVLRYTLGIFSLVSEVLAGYKVWRARSRLLSRTARTVRERDRREQELIQLHAAVETAKAEPDIRRAYRTVGARQYMAWSAGIEQRTSANHLKRALTGA